jgi:outer membrane biogenesis lipoprotein LolB
MVSRISILILLSLLLFGCTATRDMKRQLAAMTTHNQELQEQNRKLTD